MRDLNLPDNSLGDVHNSVDITGKPGKKMRVLAFLGPAYLVSVGYMDPGNWATDLQGGSQFKYALIWVLLMSNLMALLLQGMSARLGIVRGRDLAQANRETYPRAINFVLYLLAEVAIAACDLAEVLGMAIGIKLLTGLPLIWGVSLTVLDTFLLLWLQRLGMRRMEAFIVALVGIIAFAFLFQLFLAKPSITEIAHGFIPTLPGKDALYIAIGIIGATVMPHNLYLHSALVQSRKFHKTDEGIRQALKFNRIDTGIALNLAFFVNAAILIVAGKVFFGSGHAVASIQDAYELLPSFLGRLAPLLFAIALIAAGQSSTITGTLAGQIIMEGYLRLRINPQLRRLITRVIAIIPAVITIVVFGEEKIDMLLVLSQVILSMQLGFAVIPLIFFVSDRQKMGKFVIGTPTKIAAWLIAIVLVGLNIKLLADGAVPYFQSPALMAKLLIAICALFFLCVFLYMLVFPIIKRKKTDTSIEMHHGENILPALVAPQYARIAVALDFSKDDHKILSYALGQGNKSAEYLLIHVVESPSAVLHGKESDDHETINDAARLEDYAAQLAGLGVKATTELGYRNRVKEIVRIVKAQKADLLVIGAHGHSGVKDLIYGETVNAVRHELKMPVLVVNL